MVGVEGRIRDRFASVCISVIAEAINNVNNIKMWRYDKMCVDTSDYDEMVVDAVERGDTEFLLSQLLRSEERVDELELLLIEERAKPISTFCSDMRQDMNDVWNDMEDFERVEMISLAIDQLIYEKKIKSWYEGDVVMRLRDMDD
jgi:hypothetical protein